MTHSFTVVKLLCIFSTSLLILSYSTLPLSTKDFKYSTMFLWKLICLLKLWTHSLEKSIGLIAIAYSYSNFRNNASSLAWLWTNWFLLSSIWEQAWTSTKTMSSLPFFSATKTCLASVSNFCENNKYVCKVVETVKLDSLTSYACASSYSKCSLS